MDCQACDGRGYYVENIAGRPTWKNCPTCNPERATPPPLTAPRFETDLFDASIAAIVAGGANAEAIIGEQGGRRAKVYRRTTPEEFHAIIGRAIAEGRHAPIEQWPGEVCFRCGRQFAGRGAFHKNEQGKPFCYGCTPQSEKEKIAAERKPTYDLPDGEIPI